MNTKTLILTLMLCTVLIGLASIRLSTHSSMTKSSSSNEVTVDDTSNDAIELIWSFELRIRLPILKKDAI
ncbi:MAG: hypothetical protein AB8G18_14500 [Gammaproteobacteria bacterium]